MAQASNKTKETNYHSLDERKRSGVRERCREVGKGRKEEETKVGGWGKVSRKLREKNRRRVMRETRLGRQGTRHLEREQKKGRGGGGEIGREG